MASGDDEWKKVTTIIGAGNFGNLKKFSSGLADEYEIGEIDDFPPFKALEVRIVMTKFTGNIIATKLGIEIEDPENKICKERKCRECD